MTIDLERILTDLRAQHLAKNHRRAQTAIDVPAAAWLWRACESEHAERVLELGSGFSSWALRHWQKRACATTHLTGPCGVWTVDDESAWLNTTALELAEQGFDINNILDFSYALQHAPAEFFDVVFVDLDNTRTRINNAERFVHWTKPGGLLVLDDWHMPHYREPMTAALAVLGVTVEPVPETTDEWGRYLAVGRRPV